MWPRRPGPRAEVSAAHPVCRTFCATASRRINQCFPRCHYGFQLPGPLSAACSHQGQPASRGRGGKSRPPASRFGFGPGSRTASRSCSPRGWPCTNQDGPVLSFAMGTRTRSSSRWAMLGIKLGKNGHHGRRKNWEELRQNHFDFQIGSAPNRFIGIRTAAVEQGTGRWAGSGGRKHAKFGLSTAELLEATENAEGGNRLSGHCFKTGCIFHIGSQVPDILTVKKGGCRRRCAALMPNCTRWASDFLISTLAAGWAWITTAAGRRLTASTNYTLQELHDDVVYYIADVCNAEKRARTRHRQRKRTRHRRRITAY